MAVKYYAGNKLTGVASDTKPTSNIIDGSTFFVTDTEDLFMYDLGTTSWKVVSGNTIAETLSSKTLTSPVLNTSLSGTAFLDEDNFASDAADKVASQQSIKAYVASQVPGSQNVFNTIAVSGQDNVVADGATDTLTFAAGTNITLTTTAGSDTVTIAASSSSSTVTVTDNENTNENNLISFVAGAATATGAHGLEMDGDLHYNPSTGRLTATQLAGTLQTAAQTAITSVGALDGGSITSNFGSINVGSSTITTSGVVTAGGFTIGSAAITEAELEILDGAAVTTAELNIIDGNTAATGTTLADGDRVVVNDNGTMVQVALTDFETYFESVLDTLSSVTTVGVLNAGSITSGFGSIDVGSSAITTTGTITAGNMTVTGTTTTLNTATITVEDPLMALASGNNAADAVDIGFYGLYDTSGSQDLYAGLFRDANDSGKWKLFKDLQAAPTTTVNTSGTGYAAGTLVAALEGNATTATTLATARTIGGTSFDGAGNIAVALAATATILANARTIGGTSFDGSANIVPATITVADTTDTTSFVALFESATGDLAPKTDAGITYNAGTGTLTATAFVGPITGNVTGNASGTAATVTGGTQASITAAANLVTVGTIGTGVWQGTAVAQTYIAAQAINESKLQGSNGPTDGYLLTARSGNAGGMTWEASSSAGASESFAIAMAVAL